MLPASHLIALHERNVSAQLINHELLVLDPAWELKLQPGVGALRRVDVRVPKPSHRRNRRPDIGRQREAHPEEMVRSERRGMRPFEHQPKTAAAKGADLGADYVIAVDLLPVLGSGDGAVNVEPRNVAEVAMTALFMLARATQIEQALADVVVTPAVAHFNLADFTVADALLDAGRRAMSAALPKILADLGR